MAAPRMLVASGSLDGVDHERFAPNELFHEAVWTKVVLTQQDVPQNFVTWIKSWGGECRLEVRITARLLAERRILVTVNGKLFEGDSESTSDLAEEKTESVVVPRGQPVPFRMSLFNSGILGGGGDSGTIDLTFTNSIAEED
ncbi:hypothetical protein B0T14DRAFT_570783 [Immersiella caudata]|uniref:Uncharacterized protein n=1 Tax=Immersiella caudata TaxID=314043 RepID=A0AA39TMU6_9PEZI|nr:hypothetical protein B0T14DRAFT_570783 [Immersiella caudata]